MEAAQPHEPPVRGVTDQLPVVGAPTGEIVDGVVDTVDTILKPR